MVYPITGIQTPQGPQGQVPLRREIDEWWFSDDVNDINQRTLFIYALTRFKDLPPNPEDPSDLSYFSIAGIHGVPLTPWDTKDPKNKNYCVHGQITFPSWHRPYMLLYEQRLYEIMKEVIQSEFDESDHDALNHAADTWRLPYWDWAERKDDWIVPDSVGEEPSGLGPNVPFMLTQNQVEVRTRTGSQMMDNPMLRYTLPGNEQFPDRKTFKPYGVHDIQEKQNGKFLFWKRYGDCRATNRHPTTVDPDSTDYEQVWIDGAENNWMEITNQLRGAGSRDSNTLPERVYRLFSLKPVYKYFATEGWESGDPAARYASLEAVHGAVHDLVGGTGWMGEVPVAGFDPIFWMHHCNIDRLYALWQDLYDDEYAAWLNSSEGKFNAKTPLTPFHNVDGDIYNSHTCSFQQRDLGYTYPELQKWLDVYQTDGQFDSAKYKRSIRASIERRYSTTGKSTLLLPEFASIATQHLEKLVAEKPKNLDIEYFPPSLLEQAKTIKQDTQFADMPSPEGPEVPSWEVDDYIVNVVFNRFALGGAPYHVRFFMGDVPETDLLPSFAATPTQIGQVYNFSGSRTDRGVSEEGCQNCRTQEEEGTLSSDSIPLTDYLVEAITKGLADRGNRLQSLDVDEVVPYLKANLHWRITDRANQIILKEDMPDLQISVARGKARHYFEVSKFSEYHSYEPLWEVTDNRRCGATPEALGLQA